MIPLIIRPEAERDLQDGYKWYGDISLQAQSQGLETQAEIRRVSYAAMAPNTPNAPET